MHSLCRLKILMCIRLGCRIKAICPHVDLWCTVNSKIIREFPVNWNCARFSLAILSGCFWLHIVIISRKNCNIIAVWMHSINFFYFFYRMFPIENSMRIIYTSFTRIPKITSNDVKNSQYDDELQNFYDLCLNVYIKLIYQTHSQMHFIYCL